MNELRFWCTRTQHHDREADTVVIKNYQEAPRDVDKMGLRAHASEVKMHRD